MSHRIVGPTIAFHDSATDPPACRRPHLEMASGRRAGKQRCLMEPPATPDKVIGVICSSLVYTRVRGPNGLTVDALRCETFVSGPRLVAELSGAGGGEEEHCVSTTVHPPQLAWTDRAFCPLC